MRIETRLIPLLVIAMTAGFPAINTHAQSGHVLPGVGPVDQALAGAGMAAPRDALGAVHWNPASIAMLKQSSLDLSIQFLLPTGTLESTVEPGAFGFAPAPFPPSTPLPPATVSGATDSEAGPFPIPAVGYVRKSPTSRLTYGLGAMFVGGFGVEYAASPAPFDNQGNLNPAVNPLLTPQRADGGFGFGAIESSFGLLQVHPTVAYKVSDQVAFGFAPTINYALLRVSPFPAAPPDPATGLYPDGPQEGAIGFGFQVGLHAESPSGWSGGLSFKSPQWFQDFEFTSEDITPGSTFSFNLDYPMILSAGVAWTGTDRLLLAADVHYIDFENTDGFRESGYDPATFAVKGFGWTSILFGAIGLEYEVTEGVPVRFGYSYNENPLPDRLAFFNTPANALIQHRIAGGVGYRLSDGFTVNAAVQYGFENEGEGLWISPAGDIQNTLVKNSLSTLLLIFGGSITL